MLNVDIAKDPMGQRKSMKREFSMDFEEGMESSCMQVSSPDVVKRLRRCTSPPKVFSSGMENISQQSKGIKRAEKRGRDASTSRSGPSGAMFAAPSSSASRALENNASPHESLSFQDTLSSDPKDNLIRRLILENNDLKRNLRVAQEWETGKAEEHRILKRAVGILEGRLRDTTVQATRQQDEIKEQRNMLQFASERMSIMQQENAVLMEALQEMQRQQAGGGSNSESDHFITPRPPPDVF